MAIPLLKPRWEAWENMCIQKAFTQKIQHKIMAAALGRTVTAVSKKIKTLGLRVPSSIRGRLKGKQGLSWRTKTPQDLTKMINILKTYAPLTYFQEGHMALQKGCWTTSAPTLSKNRNKGACVARMDHYNVPFSFVSPLDFIPSKGSNSQEAKEMGAKKVPGEPDYVPLCYIEQWAQSKGFYKVRGILYQRGLSYWKDGSYFSRAQLLMHINRLRFEHHLQAITLIEAEKKSLA